MRTLVIYKSGSGYVKKYAEWIKEELDCEILEQKETDSRIIKRYDTVIYGGGIYAAGINGIKKITKNMDILEDKNIIVFFSGVSPYREKMFRQVTEKNFSAEQLKKIKVFYMRGGFDFNRLAFPYKAVMKLMEKNLRRKKEQGKELTEDEAGMLQAFDEPVDFTSRKNIKKLTDYVGSIE